MKIGFIGMGIMGSRMAANLQKQGYELVVCNRTPDKATSLINNGALWAETPAEVAKQVDVLFTMLAHPEAVRKTALGENGFIDSLGFYFFITYIMSKEKDNITQELTENKDRYTV